MSSIDKLRHAHDVRRSRLTGFELGAQPITVNLDDLGDLLRDHARIKAELYRAWALLDGEPNHKEDDAEARGQHDD